MPSVNVFAIFGTSIYNNFYPGSIIFTQQVSVKEPEFSKKFRLIFNLISKQNVVINRGFLVSAVYLELYNFIRSPEQSQELSVNYWTIQYKDMNYKIPYLDPWLY